MITITTLEIYNMAYNTLLERWQREESYNKQFIIEHNRESSISIARIKKYKEQIAELHAEILKLESEIDYKLI